MAQVESPTFLHLPLLREVLRDLLALSACGSKPSDWTSIIRFAYISRLHQLATVDVLATDFSVYVTKEGVFLEPSKKVRAYVYVPFHKLTQTDEVFGRLFINLIIPYTKYIEFTWSAVPKIILNALKNNRNLEHFKYVGDCRAVGLTDTIQHIINNSPNLRVLKLSDDALDAGLYTRMPLERTCLTFLRTRNNNLLDLYARVKVRTRELILYLPRDYLRWLLIPRNDGFCSNEYTTRVTKLTVNEGHFNISVQCLDAISLAIDHFAVVFPNLESLEFGIKVENECESHQYRMWSNRYRAFMFRLKYWLYRKPLDFAIVINIVVLNGDHTFPITNDVVPLTAKKRIRVFAVDNRKDFSFLFRIC